jgi:hypothetical protein
MSQRRMIIPLWSIRLNGIDSIHLENADILPYVSLPNNVRKWVEDHNFGNFKHYVYVDTKKGVNDKEIFIQTQIMFKLFKEGRIVFKFQIGPKEINELEIHPNYGLDFIPYYTYWTRPTSRFELNQSEVDLFKSHWKLFWNIPRTNFALNRFHLADFRPLMDDSFLDYVLALEHLLSPVNRTEVGFQFRAMGTLLLGDNFDKSQKLKLFNLLDKAYGIRSDIVHGRRVKIGNTNETKLEDLWEDKIRPIRMLTRKAIKYFYLENCLENHNKRKDLIKKRIIFESQIGEMDQAAASNRKFFENEPLSI